MFTFKTKVSYSRVDKNGQVPLHEIMNYFQDCTNFHSESLGVGVEYMESAGKGWVIVSYKIKVNRPILLGQDIIVGTAPTKFGGLYASRQFVIKDSDGEILALADSIWVLMELDNRKPVRITEKDSAVYVTEPEIPGITANRKIKFSGEKKQLPAFKVMKTYIDNNGHMNNADYLRAAEEFLPEEVSRGELDIIYRKEAMEGEMITPYLYKETDGLGISFESAQGDVLTKIKLI